jgi:hypothetical protein
MLWGTGIAGDESRPKWLYPSTIDHHYNLNKCFASMRGWEVTHENNLEELIVAIPGLSNSLAGASIAAMEWGETVYTDGTIQTVVVIYNERVTVTAGATLLVHADVAGDITATYVSTSKNQVTFNFTVPAAANVLSIDAQSIVGTIVDYDGDLGVSSLVISSDVAAAIYPAATQIVV